MSEDSLFLGKSKINFYVVIISTILLYLFTNFVVSLFLSNAFLGQVIELFLWLGFVVFIWWLPRLKYGGELKIRNDVKWWAFSAGLIHVLITFIAGLFGGLGKSPYDHSISGIILNILFIGGPLLGREVVRSYIINHYKMKKSQLPLYVVGIGMGILGIAFRQLYNLHEFEDIFKYSSKYILPEISKSILATYLAYLGGFIPAVIYMGIIEGFHWLSPVLPDLEWLLEALIGVSMPIFSYLWIQNIYRRTSKKIRKDKSKEEVIGGALTCIVSVGIVWFVVGVFPLYPSVIATGSMEPVIYPGDVIIIDKIQKEEEIKQLQVGDIIQFERNDILISHRIIEHKLEDGMDSFCTKGDNNTSSDEEVVKAEMIKGKVVKVIPKVGWPTLLIKDSNKEVPVEIINGTKVVEMEQKE